MSSSSSSSSSSPPSSVVTDDAFIDVMLPGTASASAAITVLHDFSACTTKFANLLPGGGMVFTVNTTTPTLIVSTANAVLGTSLREYVATQLYLVPKLHASNQLPQVSSSDLEIVVEHGLSAASSSSSSAAASASSSGAGSSGSGKNTRYFLCAVVSADAAIAEAGTTSSDGASAAAPALIGNDAALTAFLRNIDTVSSASAQLKANNAKRLPLDTPLSFPGISTCMSYPDTKGNTVLLTSAPLLASPALVARLFALVSASAPVFSNFDLQQAQGSSVSLVGFRANAPALAFAPIVSVSSVDTAAAAPGDTAPAQEEAFQTPTKAASSSSSRQNNASSTSSNNNTTTTTTGPLTSSQVLALVSLLVVGALVVLPAWLYGPQIYAFSVIQASGVDASTVSGTDPASVNRGILVTKGFYVLGSVLAAVLVGVGASMALYPALIAGIVIALMLCALVASVFYDAGVRSHSVVRGIPGINPARLLDVLRYDYTSSTTA